MYLSPGLASTQALTRTSPTPTPPVGLSDEASPGPPTAQLPQALPRTGVGCGSAGGPEEAEATLESA